MKLSKLIYCTMIVAGIHTQAFAADLVAGEKISQSCSLCHGQFGITTMAGTPSIAGQPEVYLSSQLKQFRDGKRQNAVMGQMAKPLSDADIDNVSAWFAQFETELKKR
jgi:cytochrome c553